MGRDCADVQWQDRALPGFSSKSLVSLKITLLKLAARGISPIAEETRGRIKIFSE